MNTLVAVLGAGSARRFGADKLAQPCAGKPLGRWALDAALATRQSVVWIAGADAPDFTGGRCNVLRNLTAERGLWTSVACAADFAERCGHGALLIVLADMPLVSAVLLARLLDHEPPVACRHADGRPGVPALFPRSLFDSLQQLSGEHGARSLLAEIPSVQAVSCDPGELLDVDRPEDLVEAERWLRERMGEG